MKHTQTGLWGGHFGDREQQHPTLTVLLDQAPSQKLGPMQFSQGLAG